MKITYPTGYAILYDAEHPAPTPHEIAEKYGFRMPNYHVYAPDMTAQGKALKRLVRFLDAKCRRIPYEIS